MNKFKAQLAGEQHEIQLRRQERTFTAAVDGHKYELEVQDLDGGQYLLRQGNNVYDCQVETNSQHPEFLNVNIRGNSFPIRLTDPKRIRGTHGAGEQEGAAKIVAPMPGKVVRILVEVGANVEAGAGIVVVEAMKMQNEMKAPKAGVVVSLNADIGATVNAGDVLAVVE
ncbi:MAG: biotin/lipoyl-containing protein [bacterium]